MNKNEIPIKYINECFDEEDGHLFWKKRPTHHFLNDASQRKTNSRMSGVEAGSLVITRNNEHRWSVGLRYIGNRVDIYRSNIVWAIHNNIWAPVEVDHISRDSLDDKIKNLRLATHCQNRMNSKLYCNNTSGTRGVRFHKKCLKYEAYITVNSRFTSLGTYSSHEEAVTVRKNAEKKYFGEFAPV